MTLPDIDPAVRNKLRRARVARLATVDSSGRPAIVPVCFIFDTGVFYSAIDRKPKILAAGELARVKNILARPDIALIIDRYRENWGELWYVLVRGRAVLLQGEENEERIRAIRLLKRKYPQYRSSLLPDEAPVIRIDPSRIKSWGKIR